MRKRFCIALVLLFALTLTACDSLLPQKQLIGTWTCRTEESREYSLALLENFDMYEEELALVQTPLYTVRYLTFNQDKTYSYATRPETEEACLREFFQGAFDDLYENRESISACYDWDMSALSKEEFLAFYAALYETEDFDALMNLWLESAGTTIGQYETGTYRIILSKIHMNADDGDDSDGYVTYQLEDNILTLTYGDAVEIYTKTASFNNEF